MENWFQTTVTQKGQITIPKEIREKLGIVKYGKVWLEPEDDHIKIIPAGDILDLAGKFKPKRNKSVLRARRELEKNYRRP